MTLQIGRIVGLNEPRNWKSQGDKVTLTGTYVATSVADGLQRRDQLLGYNANVDEPVIPVSVGGEPRLSGFYKPSRVQVNTDPTVLLRGNLVDYLLDLDQVQGFASPQFESVWSGTLMANDFAIPATTAVPWHAVTSSIDELSTDFANVETRESADDVNGISFWSNGGGAGQPYVGNARWSVAPARYYWSAPVLSMGAALQPIVGRAIAKPDFANWQLSNGVVRVTPSATPANLMFSYYGGAAWSTPKEFSVMVNSIGQRMNAITSFTVLRNDAAAVVIRLGMAWPLGIVYQPNAQLFLDITLRRGSMGVDCYLALGKNLTAQFIVGRYVAEAATTLTGGGIYATTPDAAGNSYLLASSKAQTQDLVNGRITSTAFLPACDFHIGFCIPAAHVGIQWTSTRPQARVYGYLGPTSETQRVVAR